jgi:hypothetical protein
MLVRQEGCFQIYLESIIRNVINAHGDKEVALHFNQEGHRGVEDGIVEDGIVALQ